MAQRAYWPNLESIKAHLAKISEEDFIAIQTTMRKPGAMRNKLEVLNQQWRAAASREKGKDPLLFDLNLIPHRKISEFYREIEKIIDDERDRRSSEARTRVEEQSRQITDEDLEFIRNDELALIDVILNENIQSPGERLDVLRLIYVCSKSHFAMLTWRKWKSIAGSNSEEMISRASQAIHKELKRRRISPREVIDGDNNMY